MSKWKDSPFLRLNKYIEEKLREEEIIPSKTLYIGDPDDNEDLDLPFMIPGGDTPESTTVYEEDTYKELPYAVYSISDRMRNKEIWQICGQITYTFHSIDIDTLFAIKQYLNVLCDRKDWSALDVNLFYKADPTYPFEFECIDFVHAAGPVISDDEGGRAMLMCIISYDCRYEGTGRIDDFNDSSIKEMGVPGANSNNSWSF